MIFDYLIYDLPDTNLSGGKAHITNITNLILLFVIGEISAFHVIHILLHCTLNLIKQIQIAA